MNNGYISELEETVTKKIEKMNFTGEQYNYIWYNWKGNYNDYLNWLLTATKQDIINRMNSEEENRVEQMRGLAQGWQQ
jgi:hypothetical protein